MAHGAGTTAAAPLLASSADEPRWNMYAFACATLASMTTMLMGYNLAVMSGAQLFIWEDIGLTDAQIEVLAGSMNVFMLVSIFAAGWAADLLGRRGTLVLANAFLMAGALAMSLGRSYAALMAARFVTSIGVGFALVVAPVYNAEISPASSRGFLSSLLNVFINVGLVLSYVSNYAFAGLPVHLGWRVMFAAGAVPPVFLAAGVLSMPESPRWLAMRGRDADARAVLVRTSDSAAEAGLRFEEIKRAADAPRQGGSVWKELVVRPSAALRRVLVCVLGVYFFQMACGIDAVVLYSPLVLKAAGMPSTSAEIVPLRLRAHGASLGTAVSRVASGAVSMTFISLARAITMPGCFLLYSGVSAAGCVFVSVWLPETRGRSLEDMDALFVK